MLGNPASKTCRESELPKQQKRLWRPSPAVNMECYSIRQYWEERGEKKHKVHQVKAIWCTPPISCWLCKLILRQNWIGLMKILKAPNHHEIMLYRDDDTHSVTPFQDTPRLSSQRCRQAGAGAVLWCFSGSLQLCHTMALSCLHRVFIPTSQSNSHHAPRSLTEFSAHYQKHTVRAEGFTKALSARSTIVQTNNKLINSVGRLGAFWQHSHQVQVDNTHLWTAEPEAVKWDSEDHPASAGSSSLLLQQCSPEDWDPRIHLIMLRSLCVMSAPSLQGCSSADPGTTMFGAA